jgi:hypothetical protein
VIVTASLLTAPRSTLENVQPPPGPTIGIAWRLDPPDPRLETTPEEPSP